MSRIALTGAAPAVSRPFPSWPRHGQEEREALLRVLASGRWWMGDGEEVLSLEREFAEYHKTRHAVAVTNGTHSLEMILTGLGVGYGDEVIIPDYTFIATATAVLFVNAIPIPVDIEPDTFCLDPDRVEAAITPDTRAIIHVYVAGNTGRIDRLRAVAARHHVPLIEDAAHGHGTSWDGIPAGNHGRAGSFSFQASKTMTAGEGGMIVTNDDSLAENLESLRNCGRVKGKPFYVHEALGSNYRMTEFQGALLRVQLRRLRDDVPRRHENAVYLDRLLSQIPGIRPQHKDPRLTMQGHYIYAFLYDPDAFQGLTREGFIEAIEAEGLVCQESYPAVHSTPLFARHQFGPRFGGGSRALYSRLPDYAEMRFPVAARVAGQAVWFPHRVLLSDRQAMEEIAEAVSRIQRHASEALTRSRTTVNG